MTARILIAYATSEGQTAKIVAALAAVMRARGAAVEVADLESDDTPDPAGHDGIIVAASVHAGSHQASAGHFASANRAFLEHRVTAFLSVSLSAAATEAAGRDQAQHQVDAFVRTSGWTPDEVERVGGALRISRLSWVKRLATRLAQRLLRREFDRLGWPADLARETEFTDWEQVQRFAARFIARVEQARQAPAQNETTRSA